MPAHPTRLPPPQGEEQKHQLRLSLTALRLIRCFGGGHESCHRFWCREVRLRLVDPSPLVGIVLTSREGVMNLGHDLGGVPLESRFASARPAAAPSGRATSSRTTTERLRFLIRVVRSDLKQPRITAVELREDLGDRLGPAFSWRRRDFLRALERGTVASTLRYAGSPRWQHDAPVRVVLRGEPFRRIDQHASAVDDLGTLSIF